MAGPALAPPSDAGQAPRECRRFALTIAFDGTGYAGWQVQKSGLGVQQRIEEALARLFPSRPQVHGSSRTDAGVHALGLVAHTDIPRTELRMAPVKLRLALNAHLPEDIRVTGVRRVPAGFHARFSALGKQYRYFVWNHPAMDPLRRTQAWHVPRALDLAAMRQAAAAFVGRQDFRAFTANPGYPRASTVRQLGVCRVMRRGPLVTFIIEADGFLYKMCRGIVGTLVQVGLGQIPATEIPRILAGADRRAAGMSAPAHGLVLWRVAYPPLRELSGSGRDDSSDEE